MTPLARALSSALLHFLWQGLVVAVVLSVALALLRKRSAQARYLASCAALGIMAALPVITMWMVYPRGVVAHGVNTGAVALAARMPLSTSADWIGRVDAWALPLWCFGVLFFAMRLMWGARQISTLRRRAELADQAVLSVAAGVAARLGLSRPVRVLMSALAEGPGVVGWVRPVILLPAATLAGLTPEQFEAVLAHEIAHILRYDYLVNLFQMLVEALLFYHPAVWWASARIRHERELCCDDLAVRACGDAVCYARALTTLERMRSSKPERAPALAMGTTGGRLLYRIERLMGTAPQEQSPARWPGIAVLAAGLACIALTTNWARGQAPAPAGHAQDQPGVKVDLGASSVLHRTGVAYPEAARKKGVQGNVTVQVTVDENGNVSDAHVLSGPEELRKSVLQSILNWHFTEDAAKSERQVGVAFQAPPAGTAERAKDLGIAVAVAESQAVIEQLKARLEALQNNGAISAQQAQLELERALADRERRGRNVEETLRFLQQQMVEAQSQLEEAQKQVPENQARIVEMEQQLRIMERKAQAAKVAAMLEQRQAELQRAKGAAQIAGRTLKSIQAPGFPEPAASSLTSRLNLRVGDTLTPESIEAARNAVHAFDEHAEVRFAATQDGQVELIIRAPQ